MPLWQAPAALVIVVTWLTAPPTSLADLSRRETLRRQLSAASTASFSNDSLPYMPPPVMSAESTLIASGGSITSEGTPATDGSAPAAGAPAPAPEPTPVPEEPKGEDWWRNRAEAARSALDRDQVLLEAMQSRVNSLQTDVVNRDDPGQRSVLQQQLNRAMGELDRLAKQIETDRKDIAIIETEARQQGVPPGWIR